MPAFLSLLRFFVLLALCTTARAEIAFAHADFVSGGKRIRLDVLAPAGNGKHPAILLLPGANGTGPGDGPGHYAPLADALRRRGFTVGVCHYFDRTGIVSADATSQVRDLPAWYECVAAALGVLEKHPRVQSGRVAVLGVSLGGTLAITLAAFEPRVGALVDWFGGFQPATEAQVRRLPPTLILHGERDRVVPVGQARRLAATAARLGLRHELKIYPDSGHGFSQADQADALERAAAFLRAALTRQK